MRYVTTVDILRDFPEGTHITLKVRDKTDEKYEICVEGKSIGWEHLDIIKTWARPIKRKRILP